MYENYIIGKLGEQYLINFINNKFFNIKNKINNKIKLYYLKNGIYYDKRTIIK